MAGLLAACRARPLSFGVLISAAKTSAADLIVQTQLEGREFWPSAALPATDPGTDEPQQRTPHRVDLRRNLIFGMFGAVYLGGVQYSIYVKLMPRLWPGKEATPPQPDFQRCA